MKKVTNYILAIDFDLTIADGLWPEIGNLRENAKDVINSLYEEGFQIRIWTCRTDAAQDAAQAFLDQHGVRYHGINTNCPERVAFYGNDSRKMGADIYIDDKCLMGLPPWNEIGRIVRRTYKLHERQKPLPLKDEVKWFGSLYLVE
jgi:hypothetical protein